MKENYESPQIEVVEIQVEKGFAVSDLQLESFGDGGQGY